MEGEICFLTLSQLSRLVRNRDVSPLEVTKAALARIDEVNPRVNAYITILEDTALKSARDAEKAIASGNYLGPLHGVPVALKDIFWIKGVRTTAGSRILADFVPRQDATVVKRLKESGAIFLGTLNLHEFAMSHTSDDSPYGVVRNPWDMERITGSSSSGPAAALAASLCFGSFGTDTGGSIRSPASLCGVVGFKPTYGRVSRHGVIPLSWSLDHIGPMARSVEDLAILFSIAAGPDRKDQRTSHIRAPDCSKGLAAGIKGLRLGLLREHFFERADGKVRETVCRAIKVLEELGATVEEVSIPHARYAYAIGAAIINAEAISYHEPYFNARPGDYGEEARARLEVGKVILAKDYLRAQRARTLLMREVQDVFQKVDILVTPTSPLTAPKIGQRMARVNGVVYKVRKITSLFTRPFNLTGNPAISVPCGFPSKGLPTGLQIVGKPFEDEKVLRVAYAYEASTPWHERRPPMLFS
ncbi:MAG: Asp-tRNA(Asn)/Glu-tRNA(Gln) amidotransferase subunit GatA [Chloroflexi bacterium]|nr:Asp-tRNA(Asn)/Glu-tRNA(Gln) amidotransferase subunit GatA [Chloroflexota bacterium]